MGISEFEASLVFMVGSRIACSEILSQQERKGKKERLFLWIMSTLSSVDSGVAEHPSPLH